QATGRPYWAHRTPRRKSGLNSRPVRSPTTPGIAEIPSPNRSVVFGNLGIIFFCGRAGCLAAIPRILHRLPRRGRTAAGGSLCWDLVLGGKAQPLRKPAAEQKA